MMELHDSEEKTQYLCLITEDDAGERLDAYLGQLKVIQSRSQAAKLIEAGKVLVNQKSCTSKKYLLQDKDRIELELPKPKQLTLVPDPIPLDVRLEDDHLLVISKPIGLVCHPSHGYDRGTLANALVAHCGVDKLGMLQGEDRPGIVHRLDRDTSGLMLAAKSDEVQFALQEMIRLRTLDRRYLCLVHGYIAPDSGIIDAPIARSERERVKMMVSDELDARQALTTFKVIERFDAARKDEGFTLVECKLYTGRTHQIRVHMHYIHHACVGDPVYSSKRMTENLGLTRQFLHSYRIAFTHPVTQEEILLYDKLPWDLELALEEIADRSLGKTDYGKELLAALEVESTW